MTRVKKVEKVSLPRMKNKQKMRKRQKQRIRRKKRT